jgi:hypothetical protein
VPLPGKATVSAMVACDSSPVSRNGDMKTTEGFRESERVRIAPSCGWAQGAVGTIAFPPDFAQQLVTDLAPWHGLTRRIKGAQKMITCYWVWFDKPQKDADGDGPYTGGETEEDAIERL